MKTPLTLTFSALAAVALTGTAAGVTKPGRTRTEAAPIVALSVTGSSVAYAVADNAGNTDCSHVFFWHTSGGSIGKWRFGKPTSEPCSEGTSTGDGISAVALAAERTLWIKYAGGNLRDWQLFTATRTKTTPKQLAFVERDVDAPPPIVVGQGTPQGVPYAVDANVTYLGDNGAAVFKWVAPAPVRLLAAGYGPGGAVVAAFLASGELDLLSGGGTVVQTYTFQPDEIKALALGPAGVVAQVTGSVQIRKGGQTTTPLNTAARMVGYGQGRIFYSLHGAIYSLRTSNQADSLLVSGTPAKPALAAYATAGGFAWAIGRTINWDCASCVDFGS